MLVVDYGREDVAMKFLLSETQKEAEEYFGKLEEINQDRRVLSDNIFEEAVLRIKEQKLYENSIIIIEDKKWHSGVTGIVASKIVDLFKRPTIVFSIEGSLAKGSGRTIPGINIYDLLTKASDIVDEYGGHEKAIGLSLKSSKLEELKEVLEKETKTVKTQVIEEYDYELKFDDVNYTTLNSIYEISPFGEKNLYPDFLFKKVEITSVNVYGNMLRLGLKQNNIHLVGIGFGLGYRQNDIKTKISTGDYIYLIGKIEENTYMDRTNLQINIKEYNLVKNRV